MEILGDQYQDKSIGTGAEEFSKIDVMAFLRSACAEGDDDVDSWLTCLDEELEEEDGYEDYDYDAEYDEQYYQEYDEEYDEQYNEDYYDEEYPSESATVEAAVPEPQHMDEAEATMMNLPTVSQVPPINLKRKRSHASKGHHRIDYDSAPFQDGSQDFNFESALSAFTNPQSGAVQATKKKKKKKKRNKKKKAKQENATKNLEILKHLMETEEANQVNLEITTDTITTQQEAQSEPMIDIETETTFNTTLQPPITTDTAMETELDQQESSQFDINTEPIQQTQLTATDSIPIQETQRETDQSEPNQVDFSTEAIQQTQFTATDSIKTIHQETQQTSDTSIQFNQQETDQPKIEEEKEAKPRKKLIPHHKDVQTWQVYCQSKYPDTELLQLLDDMTTNTLVSCELAWIQANEDQAFNHHNIEWVEGLLTRLSEPILRGTASDLRELLMLACIQRAKLPSNQDPLLPRLNGIITVITKFYGQIEF